MVRSLVSQLLKENEKFIYGCVKSRARAREFEEAIEWLVSSGIVLRIYDVTKAELAIRFSELPYKEQDDMVNVPLYLAGQMKKIQSGK